MSNDKQPKLCKYCKYNHMRHSGNAECEHPNNYHIKTNLVTGYLEKKLKDGWRDSCKLQREDSLVVSFFNRTCGKSGKWYVRDLNKFKDEIKDS